MELLHMIIFQKYSTNTDPFSRRMDTIIYHKHSISPEPFPPNFVTSPICLNLGPIAQKLQVVLILFSRSTDVHNIILQKC